MRWTGDSSRVGQPLPLPRPDPPLPARCATRGGPGRQPDGSQPARRRRRRERGRARATPPRIARIVRRGLTPPGVSLNAMKAKEERAMDGWMRHRSRGGRQEARNGTGRATGTAVPRDPAPVPDGSAGAIASGPLLVRRPEPRIPVRKVMLAVLGLSVVVAALLSSYASALGNPSPRHVPVAVSAPPAA